MFGIRNGLENRRTKKMRRTGCLFLATALVAGMLTGCGQKETSDDSREEEKGIGLSSELLAQVDPNQPMGRYMEETVALPEEMNASGKLMKTKDGMWIFELGTSFRTWFCPDGADTWEAKELPEAIRNTYTTSYAVSDGGMQVFACYEKIQGTEVYEYVIRAVDSDQAVTELARYNIPVGDLLFDADGNLYVIVSGTVHRLNPQTLQDDAICNVSTVAERMTLLGDKLLIVDDGKIWIYNLTTGSLDKEDPVLNDFMKENISGMGATDGNIYQACTFPGEEDDVLYLACSKGIFRHVLYGNVMEQMVDGSLSCLGDPSKRIQGMEIVETPGGDVSDDTASGEETFTGEVSFLALFYGNQLVQFTYHRDVPTVPSHQLKVYSLTESAPLRQMIALFQQKYPDCYVSYEVGMSGAGSTNTADLLKKLNTELMAGEGPDVLILDGLDQDTYQSKGLLMELGSVIQNLPEELLPQIVEASTQNGEIYSIPAGFAVPMAVGDKKLLKKLKTVENLPDVTENYRKTYPDGVIWGSAVPECIMGVMCELEGSGWLEQGELQENVLRQSVERAIQIYETETLGVTTDEPMEEKQTEAELYPGSGVRDRALASHYMLHSSTVSMMLKQQKAALGYVRTPFDLCWVEQLPENTTLIPLADEEGIGFKPYLQLAINSNSAEPERAAALLQLILSEEAQQMNNLEWAPVNQKAFEASLKDTQGLELRMAGEDAEGQSIDVCAVWPTDKILGIYENAVKKMNHAVSANEYLADTVTDVAGQDLKKGKNAEEIVDDIKRKTAIYLGE